MAPERSTESGGSAELGESAELGIDSRDLAHLKSLVESADLVVIQYMFRGNIKTPGAGASGGLSTLLSSFGDEFVNQNPNSLVLTLTGREKNQDREVKNAKSWQLNSSNTLRETRNESNHFALQLPVAQDLAAQKTELVNLELLILEKSTRQLYSQLGLTEHKAAVKTLIHLRYNDRLSLLMSNLATELDFKQVLTLTPDPHRKLKLNADLTDSSLDDLAKLAIADQLLAVADAVVRLPTALGERELREYFPQLTEFKKPIKAIPEGISELTAAEANRVLERFEVTPANKPDNKEILEFIDLSDSVLLSVGRLDHTKQQDKLVEAWVERGLWKDYQLLIIGGNPDSDLTPDETKILENIAEVLAKAPPEASSKYKRLAAQPNFFVRAVEQRLAQRASRSYYVCSSFKEEFGIAVLEAMASGLVIIGPKRGGLSSYIVSRFNGFLIDTSSVDSLGRELEQVLATTDLETTEIIGARARDLVQTSFTTKIFLNETAALYREVVGQKISPTTTTTTTIKTTT